MLSIADLNQSSQAAFVAALGAVFENAPSIADRAWSDRPFADVADLHQKMVSVMRAMSREEQLALIRSHPDLGSRVEMATASVQEQAAAGLDRLTAEEFDRFHRLNQQYQEKFGFPFIVAVKNHSKASILEAFDRRLHNSADAEMEQALGAIVQIARFRLANLVITEPGET